jgi:hypothetical protein
MNGLLVDSNVILDVFEKDPVWARLISPENAQIDGDVNIAPSEALE